MAFWIFGFFETFRFSGTPARCANAICQGGTCFEQTIGTTIYAYCNCRPGFTGRSCELCSYLLIRKFSIGNHLCLLLGYFTCTQIGIFPDPPNCAIGRYFYCPAAAGGKSLSKNSWLAIIFSFFSSTYCCKLSSWTKIQSYYQSVRCRIQLHVNTNTTT